MLGPLGGPELLVLLMLFAAPFAVLASVARARGQSFGYVAFGFLSWLGVIVGLLIMMAMPRRT